MKTDYESWSRKELFEFFNVSNPFYSLCFNLDVTKLYSFTKEKGISFYYALIWLSCRAMDSVEAFRWSFSKGEPFLLEGRMPSFTDMKKGAENFHIVTMPCEGSIEEFCAAAAEKSSSQQSFIDMSMETQALAYYSCLPWMDISALTNEREMDSLDSIPRLAWGKFREENGRKTLGYSIEVNHRFIDGYHIGLFVKRLEELIDSL